MLIEPVKVASKVMSNRVRSAIGAQGIVSTALRVKCSQWVSVCKDDVVVIIHGNSKLIGQALAHVDCSGACLSLIQLWTPTDDPDIFIMNGETAFFESSMIKGACIYRKLDTAAFVIMPARW